MKIARATLTFDQIGKLIAGETVTVRVPEQRLSVVGKPELSAQIAPAIEIQLSRKPLGKESWGHYEVTYRSGGGCGDDPEAMMGKSFDHFMDKAFDRMDGAFEAMSKGFHKVFGLPPSK
jgi:hypothetical protein